MKLFYPIVFLALAACTGNGHTADKIGYELLSSLPHNSDYFTQGLLIENGVLFEGTGQYGASRLIRYRDDRQNPAAVRPLPARYFGEGIAILNNELYQLTWRSGEVFVYDPQSFELQRQFQIEGEGWGVAEDGEHLWVSNGSNRIVQYSPAGEPLGSIRVTWQGAPLDRLNELEWIDGEIWANRWYDSKIYRLSPQTGEVTGVLDLTDLARPHLTDREHVLNGIAWDSLDNSLWVTGKYWDRIYQLKLY